MNKLTMKRFEELDLHELYEILRVRSEVFVVEQNCVYQDIDGIDERSLHCFYMENNNIIAYLRAFETGDGVAQIGRVLTVRRSKGFGAKLLKEGIKVIRKEMNPRTIILEAQTYAEEFYAREGFERCSDEFLEDGIPHVRMILNI